MCDNIKVAIKARPLLKKVKENVCWKITDNSIQLNETEPFYFDHIFDQNSTNQAIFDIIAKPIVNSCMKGINGTIFAYGQTSSGKTYTMLGDDQNPGVIILAMREIFNFIENSNRLFLLRIGYIEIYNEKIYDLLNKDNRDLKIHELGNGDVNVNCSEFIVTSIQEILKYLQAGNKVRKFGETNMNERSSRSHAIFKLTVESREHEDNQSESFQVSSLNLVDLAGSERADQTGATGSRLIEGSHINKSLLSLGLVIKSLSENGSNDNVPFINYRNSKLTRILQASLGGNALTAIICTIKLTTVEETNSTLNFALRAKKIKNKPHVNEVISDAAMMKILEKKVSKLQNELEKEKKKNSKLKILELEKQIRDETHKIVYPMSLRHERYDRNRRRTWCPSSYTQGSPMLPEPNNLEKESDSRKTVNSDIPFQPPLSNFLTPFITLRNDEAVGETPESDLFTESPILIDSFIEENPGLSNQFQTPKHSSIKSREEAKDNKKSLEVTTAGHVNSDLESLKREYEELKTFTNLENQFNISNEINLIQSLKVAIEACQSESWANKLTFEQQKSDYLSQIEDLESNIQFLYRNLDDKNVIISEFEKLIKKTEKEINYEKEMRVNFEIELEQYRNKFKSRETELLDVIREQNETLVKIKSQEKIYMEQVEKSIIINNGNMNCKKCISFAENNSDLEEYKKQIFAKSSNTDLEISKFLINYENNYIRLSQMNENLFQKYINVEAEIKNLETDLENAKMLIKKKDNEYSVLQTLFSNLKIEYDVNLQKFALKEQNFTNDYEILELKINKKDALICEIQDECTSLKELALKLFTNIKELQKDQDHLMNLNDETMKLQNLRLIEKIGELQNTEKLLNESNSKNENYHKVIKNLSADFGEINLDLKDLKVNVFEKIKSGIQEIELIKNILVSANLIENSSKTSIEINEALRKMEEKIKFFENENQNLLLKNEEYNLETRNLKEENESLSEKIIEAVMNLDQLATENENIKLLIETYKNEMQILRKNLDKIEDEKIKLKHKNNEIQNINDELTKENENMKSLIETYKKEIETLRNKLDEMQGEKNKLKHENNGIQNINNELTKVNENLKNQIETYENEIQSLRNNMDKIENEKYKLKHENHEMKNTNNSLISRLELLINDCKISQKEINQLKLTITNIKRQNESFILDVKTRNENNKISEEKIKLLQEEIKELQMENEKYKNTINDLHGIREILDKELASNEAASNEISRRWELFDMELNQKSSNIISINESLKQQIEKLRLLNNDLMKQIEELNSKNALLSQEISLNTITCNDLINSNKKFEADNKKLANDLVESEKKYDEVLAKMDHLTNYKDSQDAELESLRQSLKMVEKQLHHLEIENNKQIRILNIDNLKLNEKLLKNEKELTDIRDENLSLKSKLKELTKLKENSYNTVQKLNTELSQLRVKNQQLQNELTEYKQEKNLSSISSTSATNLRKLRRQSSHDETRFFLTGFQMEAATMTDPVSELCNCATYAQQLSEIKGQMLIKDSQLRVLHLKLNNNMMKDEIIELKEKLLEKENEIVVLKKEISKLNCKLEQQSQKFGDHLRDALINEKTEKKKLNAKIIEIGEELKQTTNKFKDELQKLSEETEKNKEILINENVNLNENLKKLKYEYHEKLREMSINYETEKEKLKHEIHLLKMQKQTSLKIEPTTSLKTPLKENNNLKQKVTQSVQTDEDIIKDLEMIEKYKNIIREFKILSKHRYEKIQTLKIEKENLLKENEKLKTELDKLSRENKIINEK